MKKKQHINSAAKVGFRMNKKLRTCENKILTMNNINNLKIEITLLQII